MNCTKNFAEKHFNFSWLKSKKEKQTSHTIFLVILEDSEKKRAKMFFRKLKTQRFLMIHRWNWFRDCLEYIWKNFVFCLWSEIAFSFRLQCKITTKTFECFLRRDSRSFEGCLERHRVIHGRFARFLRLKISDTAICFSLACTKSKNDETDLQTNSNFSFCSPRNTEEKHVKSNFESHYSSKSRFQHALIPP